MDSSSPPSKRRHWQSASLLLVGMLFFGLSIHLACTTPVFDRAARFVNGEELTAIVTTLPSTSGTRRTLVLKLADGTIVEQEQSFFFAAGFVAIYPEERKRLTFTRLSEGTAQFPTYPFRYSLASFDQDEVTATQEFEFPVSPTWIADSIFVGSDPVKVYSIDASTGVRSELLHQFTGGDARILRIPSSQRSVCVNTAVPRTTGINFQTQFASLLEVDANGQLKSVWNSELYSEFAIKVIDGKLFYVTPDAKSVACLDTESLTVIAEDSLPSEMVDRMAEWQRTGRGTCSISIRDRVLSFLFPDDENCHYLLPEMKRIRTVDKFTFAVPIQGHDDLLGLGVFEGDLASVKVIDLATMQEKWRWQIGKIDGFEEKDGKFFFTTAQFGITADVLDVRTGDVLFHSVPYKSLVWLLPLILFGSTLWSWQVVRWSQRVEVAGWAVATVLSLMYLSVLLTHLTYWKYYQQPIVIHQYAQGYFIAALSVSYAWMVWGKGRWFVRCLPLFIITVVLILLARWMLSELSVAVEAVVTTMLVSVFSLPVFIGLRWWGLGKRESAEALPKITWRLPMRDLFIISTVAAILLAAALPLARGLRLSIPAPQFLSVSLSALGLMLLGFGLATVCYFKRWNTGALIAILVLSGLITVEALFEFATGEPLFVPREYFTMVLLRIFGSAVLLFFFLAHCCLGASGMSNSCRV